MGRSFRETAPPKDPVETENELCVRGLEQTPQANLLLLDRGGCSNTYSADVYGNMLEYPSGQIVSHTAFNQRNSDSVLALFRSKGYYVDELLKKSAEDIVDEFIKVTNTGKGKWPRRRMCGVHP